MGKVTHPKSFRLTSQALARLNAYCELSGLDASEVARAAIAQFIAPALQGVTIEVKSKEPIKDDLTAPTQAWFKTFWDDIKYHKVFPKRVIKTIKDNWEDLKEYDPSDLQNKYNQYCESEELAGREFCHPNSWLANAGYENEKTENNSGLAWDDE